MHCPVAQAGERPVSRREAAQVQVVGGVAQGAASGSGVSASQEAEARVCLTPPRKGSAICKLAAAVGAGSSSEESPTQKGRKSFRRAWGRIGNRPMPFAAKLKEMIAMAKTSAS